MEEDQEREQEGQEPSAPKLSGVDLIRFKCIMNAEYHADRERHYSALHKLMMFLVVIVGFAAFGFELGDIHFAGLSLAPFCTFIAGTAGTIDLVLDVDGKARLHASFKIHYVDLRSRLDSGQKLEDAELELIRTSADEPPVVHPVIEFAHNTAIDIMGLNKDQQFDLGRMQILLRHLWPYNSIPTRREKRRDEDLVRSRIGSSSATSSPVAPS